MYLSRWLLASCFASLTAGLPRHLSGREATEAQDSLPTYTDQTVFQAPSDYTAPGTLYARTVQLADGSLLATWENYSPEPPLVYFPIYKSTDFGQSWTELSRVQDTARGLGLRYQPFLYVLPEDWSGFTAGTIFLSGSSIPTDLSATHIELYASTDSGESWEFVSHIADGGEAVPNNGLTPVWEPFLLLHQGELICFYSDQRDNTTHGQKLVHQTTTDGQSWSEVIEDAAFANYTDRPGMTTVAQLKSGKWIMTFEYGGGPSDGVLTDTYQFPVFYKIADDPRQFGPAEAMPLVALDGATGDKVVPNSSPYVVVDEDGLVIVSCGTMGETFVNADPDVGVDGWVVKTTGQRSSYSRSLNLIKAETNGQQGLLIAGGGALPPSTGNKVTVGLVDISGW